MFGRGTHFLDGDDGPLICQPWKPDRPDICDPSAQHFHCMMGSIHFFLVSAAFHGIEYTADPDQGQAVFRQDRKGRHGPGYRNVEFFPQGRVLPRIFCPGMDAPDLAQSQFCHHLFQEVQPFLERIDKGHPHPRIIDLQRQSREPGPRPHVHDGMIVEPLGIID